MWERGFLHFQAILSLPQDPEQLLLLEQEEQGGRGGTGPHGGVTLLSLVPIGPGYLEIHHFSLELFLATLGNFALPCFNPWEFSGPKRGGGCPVCALQIALVLAQSEQVSVWIVSELAVIR